MIDVNIIDYDNCIQAVASRTLLQGHIDITINNNLINRKSTRDFNSSFIHFVTTSAKPNKNIGNRMFCETQIDLSSKKNFCYPKFKSSSANAVY